MAMLGRFGTNSLTERTPALANLYDAAAQRLYVAAESGEVTVLDRQRDKLMVIGSAHLADRHTSWRSTRPPNAATTPFRRGPTVTRHSSNGPPPRNRHSPEVPSGVADPLCCLDHTSMPTICV